MLKIGTKAPQFSLPDQDGKIHNLSDYLGKKVLLYFYPKDDTPGCTTEACNFRDGYKVFQDMGLVILGVSADSVKSHKKFADKFKLPFPLLSDETKKTIEDYGVWQKKKFMGREYMGIERSSFLIDEKGNLEKIYEKVKAKEHAEEVKSDIK
jgi:thioredoxin-dependent peroxiredoxin